MRMLGYVGILIVLVITAWWAIIYFKTSAPVQKEANNAAVQAAAQALYYQQKSAGVDFSEGPCLSNNLLKGWVVDIAHNPREAIDDLPKNQCSAYIEGEAKHFIELDPSGNLIRMQ